MTDKPKKDFRERKQYKDLQKAKKNPFKGAKKGDTEKWNKKKKSGWVYDGTHWVHYRQGKPTGSKERHRMHTNPLKSLGLYTLGRTILRIPSEKEVEKAKWAKKYSEAKKKREAEAKNKKVESKQPIKKTEPTTTKETPKVKEKEKLKVKSSETKSKSTSKPKKRLTAREKMRAKNVERFGQEHVDKLRAKHADFKKMKKKEMSKADFIEKYPKSQTAKKSRR